jgi:hypothetical protein
MEITVISEECHGMIGIAANYSEAIKWLVDTAWIYGGMDIWYEDKWQTIEQVFGNDWKEHLDRITEEHLDGCFYFQTMKVMGN